MATAKKGSDRQEEEAREAVQDEVEFVPNPLYQSASVDTTGGGPGTADVTPIFAQARAQAFGDALSAIEDPKVENPDNVVLPSSTDDLNDEEAIAKLRDSAEAAKAEAEEKTKSGGLIAETSDDSKVANAKSDADKADEAKKASDK